MAASRTSVSRTTKTATGKSLRRPNIGFGKVGALEKQQLPRQPGSAMTISPAVANLREIRSEARRTAPPTRRIRASSARRVAKRQAFSGPLSQCARDARFPGLYSRLWLSPPDAPCYSREHRGGTDERPLDSRGRDSPGARARDGREPQRIRLFHRRAEVGSGPGGRDRGRGAGVPGSSRARMTGAARPPCQTGRFDAICEVRAGP